MSESVNFDFYNQRNEKEKLEMKNTLELLQIYNKNVKIIEIDELNEYL